MRASSAFQIRSTTACRRRAGVPGRPGRRPRSTRELPIRVIVAPPTRSRTTEADGRRGACPPALGRGRRLTVTQTVEGGFDARRPHEGAAGGRRALRPSTRRWNPKMKRYIFAQRGGIYTIDLTKTQRAHRRGVRLRAAPPQTWRLDALRGTEAGQQAVLGEAERADMPYVCHRWLGGLMTNWRTITNRIAPSARVARARGRGTQLDPLPTKPRSSTEAELEKLETNLGGVADMGRLPHAMFMVDPGRADRGEARRQASRPAGDRARRHPTATPMRSTT